MGVNFGVGLDLGHIDKGIATTSAPKGAKKHAKKALKNVVKLYSSFPSEVVSILSEFLLKALESADVVESPDSSQVGNSGAYHAQLDDWKPLIIKLSNEEPEMLLSLLKTVLQMIDTREALKHDSGAEHLGPERNGFHQTEHLSCLFEWLVGNLRDLKISSRKITAAETVGSPNRKSLPEPALVDLLRKCLMFSSFGNNHLTTAASVLAQAAGHHTLVQKLNKLPSLHTSNTEETAPVDSESFYNQQENSIRHAAKKLEAFKQKLAQKSNFGETKKKSSRWSVAKSWKPCPIGVLPCDIGSSGLVPVLDIVDEQEEHEKLAQEVNECGGKREADCPVEVLDDSCAKRRKDNECIDEEDSVFEGVENRLLVGGVWKRLTDDELISIASGVRILV